MRRVLAALALLPALSVPPAFAEKAATGATVPKSGAAPAAGKPARASAMKPINEAEMLKAQKAAAERDKAWDTRTRNSMSSICKGC